MKNVTFHFSSDQVENSFCKLSVKFFPKFRKCFAQSLKKSKESFLEKISFLQGGCLNTQKAVSTIFFKKFAKSWKMFRTKSKKIMKKNLMEKYYSIKVFIWTRRNILVIFADFFWISSKQIFSNFEKKHFSEVHFLSKVLSILLNSFSQMSEKTCSNSKYVPKTKKKQFEKVYLQNVCFLKR